MSLLTIFIIIKVKLATFLFILLLRLQSCLRGLINMYYSQVL